MPGRLDFLCEVQVLGISQERGCPGPSLTAPLAGLYRLLTLRSSSGGLWCRDRRRRQGTGWSGRQLGSSPPTLLGFPPGPTLALATAIAAAAAGRALLRGHSMTRLRPSPSSCPFRLSLCSRRNARADWKGLGRSMTATVGARRAVTGGHSGAVTGVLRGPGKT